MFDKLGDSDSLAIGNCLASQRAGGFAKIGAATGMDGDERNGEPEG